MAAAKRSKKNLGPSTMGGAAKPFKRGASSIASPKRAANPGGKPIKMGKRGV